MKWSQGHISADFVSIADLGRRTLRGLFTGSSVSGWDISQVSCGLSEISHGERSAPQHPASFLGCVFSLCTCVVLRMASHLGREDIGLAGWNQPPHS